MAYELWALDIEAREAVLHGEDGWILLSLDHGWRPVALGGPDAALRWSLLRHVVPAGLAYPTLQEALVEVRRVCSAALREGKAGAPEVKKLLRRGGLNPVERGFLQIIQDFTGTLDRFFRARGLSENQTFEQILQVFLRLRRRNAWQDLGRRALAVLLLELAREVAEGEEDVPRTEPGTGSAPADLIETDLLQERAWVRKELVKLSWEALACLGLWAEGEYAIDEIARVLDVSSEKAEEELAAAAEKLRRLPEQLRSPWLAQLCQRILHDRAQAAG